MKPGLILQHGPTSPPGLFGEWAQSRDVPVEVCRTFADGALDNGGTPDVGGRACIGNAASICGSASAWPPWAATPPWSAWS